MTNVSEMKAGEMMGAKRPALLMLRGLSREQRHWGAYPDRVRAALPGLRVELLDLPGAGTEYLRDSPTTLSGITDDIRARWLSLPHVGEHRWALFAMSLGGMIVLDWGVRYPDDFGALIACSTSSAGLTPPWKRMQLRVIPRVIATLARRDPLARERAVLAMTTALNPNLDAIAEEWAAVQVERPMKRANVVRQLRAAMRFRVAGTPKARLLLLAGAGDALTHPEATAALAQHLGVPSKIHPGAGHELALDAPEWLCNETVEWLRATGVA